MAGRLPPSIKTRPPCGRKRRLPGARSSKRAGRAVELRPAPKARTAAHPQERSLIAGARSTYFQFPADSLLLPVSAFSSWSRRGSPQHGIGRCGSQCQQRSPLRRDGCSTPDGFAAARPGKGQDYRQATDFFRFTSVFMRLRPARPPTTGTIRHSPTCGA
jgi:hypothetical protein